MLANKNVHFIGLINAGKVLKCLISGKQIRNGKLKIINIILFMLFIPLVGQVSASSCFSDPKENVESDSQLKIELENRQRQKAHENIQARNRTACLLSFEQYKKLPVSKVLVDVRKTTQAKAIPILNKNVINIPLYTLKQKTFLKNKSVILIPAGAELRELLLTCGKLRKKGFKKVYVLKDGATSLQMNTGEKILPSNRLGVVSAKQLFVERFERDWNIVYLDNNSPGKLEQYFDVKKSSKSLRATMKESLAKNRPAKKPGGIVIVDANGGRHPDFKNQLNNSKYTGVYYLEGGVQSFNGFIHKQYLQTEKSEFVLQKPKSCS